MIRFSYANNGNTIILERDLFYAEVYLDKFYLRKSPRAHLHEQHKKLFKGFRINSTGIQVMQLICEFMTNPEWAEFRTHLQDDYAIECYNKVKR